MNFPTAPSYSIKGTGKKGIPKINLAINELTGEDFASTGPKYNTQDLGIKSRSISYGIGKSTRTSINFPVENTPSPDKYNPMKSTNYSVKHSIPKS